MKHTFEILIKGTRGGWFWMRIFAKGTNTQAERYVNKYAIRKNAKAVRKVYSPT